MVQIKTPEQIAKMRAAGLVVAAIHQATRAAAVPGATTKDLDDVARKVLAEHGAKSNFLGYGGFPATICTSKNEVVVHGIPSEDVVLKDGDIISIDAGAIIDGWHGDAAFTAFVGSGHAPELVEGGGRLPRARPREDDRVHLRDAVPPEAVDRAVLLGGGPPRRHPGAQGHRPVVGEETLERGEGAAPVRRDLVQHDHVGHHLQALVGHVEA